MGTSFTALENNSAKRLIGIGAVIFLHLIIFYALMAGLSKTIHKPEEPTVELMIIQDKPPEPEKPKPKETNKRDNVIRILISKVSSQVMVASQDPKEHDT